MIFSSDLPLALGKVLPDLSAHRLMDVLIQRCITGNPGEKKKNHDYRGLCKSFGCICAKDSKGFKTTWKKPKQNWIKPD